jgi:hypothetical protein
MLKLARFVFSVVVARRLRGRVVVELEIGGQTREGELKIQELNGLL